MIFTKVIDVFKSAYFKNTLRSSLGISISVSSFVGVFISLIPSEEENFWRTQVIIIASVFVLLLLAFMLFRLLKKERTLGKFNNNVVKAMYGDILEIGKKEKKPVVVIPVNSAYDYLVENNLNVQDPIVSEETIHGEWIIKMTNLKKEKLKELKKEINAGIKKSKLQVVETLSDKRGNKNRYGLGSAIFVERDDCTYLLFALTDFDKDNHVIERHIRYYSDLVEKLIKEINRCQGRDVYVPVMGVGLSSFGLTHKRAFEILKNAFISQKDSLKSSVSIVIRPSDKDKVTIFD